MRVEQSGLKTWREMRTARDRLRVWDSGFGVWGVGFGVEGQGVGVQGVGSEQGSDLRRIDLWRHSTLGPRVIKKRRRTTLETTPGQINGFFSQLPYKCHLKEVESMRD